MKRHETATEENIENQPINGREFRELRYRLGFTARQMIDRVKSHVPEFRIGTARGLYLFEQRRRPIGAAIENALAKLFGNERRLHMELERVRTRRSASSQ